VSTRFAVPGSPIAAPAAPDGPGSRARRGPAAPRCSPIRPSHRRRARGARRRAARRADGVDLLRTGDGDAVLRLDADEAHAQATARAVPPRPARGPDERADRDDRLAAAPADARPVVRVRRARQVLVLAELLAHRGHDVLGATPSPPPVTVRLTARRFARATMLASIAPELKSWRWRTSLAPRPRSGPRGTRSPAPRRRPPRRAVDERAAAARSPPCSASSAASSGTVAVEAEPEDLARRGAVGPLDPDLHVEPPGPQDGRVDHVLAVRGADDDDVAQALDPVDLREQLGTMVVSTSVETPVPRVRNSASISSKKTTTGCPSRERSRARWKMRRICRSVSPRTC
jgi:hypothetical protein